MIIILLLLPIFEMKQLSYNNIVHSIDCGNYMKYHSFDDINYQNDQFFKGSSEFVDYYNEQEHVKVKQTLDQELYLTQRQGQNFVYQLPLYIDQPETSNYILTLNFAELQYQESNARIFEVYFGNKLVIENLDIYQQVGMRTAYKIEINFQIIGQQVVYQGGQILGAISKNNEFLIRFKAIKGKAAIAGIMLQIGDNQVEALNIQNPRNTFKAVDGFKKLSDESLKIIEQEVKQLQQDFNKKDANQEDETNNRRSSKKQLKLFEFSIKLLNILIRAPFGIVLASSFLGICLITLFELFYNRKSKERVVNKSKNEKLD